MYQVKVMDRKDSSVIMESDIFKTLGEADELQAQIGSGESYYSMVFKIDAVLSDLDAFISA
jgi:hypothetical protein